MRLVLRRARGVKSLLLAATGAAIIATVLITGLAGYSRDVLDDGARAAVAAASADERTILVQGPASDLDDRDRAVRERAGSAFAGFDTGVSLAGYATGRQLTGDVGAAVPDEDGAVFASVVFLENLPQHADLIVGAWPEAGAAPVRTAVAEAAAQTLDVQVGDRVQITDRLSERVSDVVVSGIWRPRDLADPYWRLAPEVADGTGGAVPGSSTYGPLVVARADFEAGFAASASAAWLIAPELSGGSVSALDRAGRAAGELSATLADDIGFGSSGLVTTRMPELVDRQRRADLVGRSALVTPVLLVVVLGGYALMLVAALLTDHRRPEIALLRARGAARSQLAGLAAREAALVVLPAAVLAPPLSAQALRMTESAPRLDAVTWAVAAAAAIGCGLAILGPSLRRGDTYVAEMAGRSRPNRRAVAQRLGLDVALVALAVLGWLQLRQYSSPVQGLGIDPLLAAAPTLGVLAGAVLALRVLPPVIRLVERYVSGKTWTATVFGAWQAGRRPHAGPVLLLALAVAVSTLAWCLASTSQRSVVEQADHRAGADLRLVETSSTPPESRAAEVAKLPGIATALPAWRDTIRPDRGDEVSITSIDAHAAREMARSRELPELGAARTEAPVVELPAGARLTGAVVTLLSDYEAPPFLVGEPPVSTAVVFATADGYRQVPLGESRNDQPLRFSLELPTEPARIAGFVVDAGGAAEMVVRWRLASLAVDGTPVDLAGTGAWQARDRSGEQVPLARDLSLAYQPPSTGGWGILARASLVVTRERATGVVPVVATPAALAALRLDTGARTRLPLGPYQLEVSVVGRADAVPGNTDAAALLADGPSVAAELFYQHGYVRPPHEWWLATRPDEHAAASAAAARLNGVELVDRRALAAQASNDPYGVGARAALFAAALGAIVLAGAGVGVDARATARRRLNELAVLQTLGAGHRLLARSLMAEQAFLGGIGVLVGALVGVAVAATMAPLVVLTPSGARPVPAPVLDVAWWPVAGTAAGLLALTLVLGGLVAGGVRQRLAAAQLRIGADV